MPAMLLRVLPGGRASQARPAPTDRGRKNYTLRHDDACETTLNPGFKWEELGAIGLPAARRTCTPGFRSLPVVVIKGQGECFACCRPRQRMRSQYSEACLNTEAVRRFWRVKRILVPGILLLRAARGRIDSGLGQQPRTNSPLSRTPQCPIQLAMQFCQSAGQLTLACAVFIT